MCPYWSRVMPMFAWPMNVDNALTLTPAPIISALAQLAGAAVDRAERRHGRSDRGGGEAV